MELVYLPVDEVGVVGIDRPEGDSHVERHREQDGRENEAQQRPSLPSQGRLRGKVGKELEGEEDKLCPEVDVSEELELTAIVWYLSVRVVHFQAFPRHRTDLIQ